MFDLRLTYLFAKGHAEVHSCWTTLANLLLDRMALSGTIPPALFDNMDYLSDIWLRDNPRLSGTLPSALLRIPTLQEAWLDNTSLSGAPLAQPINATSLQSLRLDNAQ